MQKDKRRRGAGAGDQLTPQTYQAFVVANWSRGKNPSRLRSVAIMSLGLAGEAGECADMLKKHLRTGKPINVRELTRELGDLQYYLARTAAQFGISLERVMAENVRKIEGRTKRNRNWRTEKNT